MTIHIDAQIAEVERELAMRRQVYPGLVSRGKMKRSEQDLHMDQMQAVLDTLRFCRDNREAIAAARAQVTT